MTQLVAQRLYSDGKSIVSRWHAPDGGLLCFGLEPGFERQPHPAIPAGTYPLRLRTVGEKHETYLRRFGGHFHHGMVEICDVPGREAIEFHIGNTIDDTLGCTLAGETIIEPRLANSGHWEVSKSLFAYQAVYPVLRATIEAGKTMLEVRPIVDVLKAVA